MTSKFKPSPKGAKALLERCAKKVERQEEEYVKAQNLVDTWFWKTIGDTERDDSEWDWKSQGRFERCSHCGSILLPYETGTVCDDCGLI